ncbi:FMN reductase [Bacteroidia bacterium]|nr:FMN reductase [Bacteroidia bacterium]
MKTINILAVIGGISKDSLNKRLYNESVKHNHTGLKFQTFAIETLPFFSQDTENNPPETVVAFRQAVMKSDAILFITPEYNRSFPGVLKNAIDWCTRPYGHNLWKRKPVGIIGASGGRIGTFGAQQQLKTVCNFLDMKLMNQPEVYFDASALMDENGLTPTGASIIQNYLAALEKWITN